MTKYFIALGPGGLLFASPPSHPLDEPVHSNDDGVMAPIRIDLRPLTQDDGKIE